MPFKPYSVENDLENILKTDEDFAKIYYETEKEDKIISEIIKHRNALGYSQKKVAEMAGVTLKEIIRLEHKSKFSVLNPLLKILDVLGLELVVVPKDGNSN